MLDIKKIQQRWDEYETAFGEDDYMDIDDHTSMAFQVPKLLAEIERLQESLGYCRNWAENIIGKGYIESDDADYIVERVNNNIGNKE